MKILIFGDNLSSLDATKLLFLPYTENIMTAATIDQAVSRIENENPDMIVVDLSPQIQYGQELCSHFRKLTQIPIIVISVLNEPKFIAGLLNAGADDYLEKPASSEMLIARMNKLMRRANVYSAPLVVSL